MECFRSYLYGLVVLIQSVLLHYCHNIACMIPALSLLKKTTHLSGALTPKGATEECYEKTQILFHMLDSNIHNAINDRSFFSRFFAPKNIS